MIDSNIGQIAFRIAFFLVFGGGILSWLTQPETPERVVSQLTFIIGLVFLTVVIVLVRMGRRQ